MTGRIILILVLIQIVAGAVILPAYADTGRIRPGETVQGRLERGDERLEDDCYYDTWELDCEVGTLLTITQSSDDIDSYLIVTGPRDAQWDNDDYSIDEGFDSRVTLLVSERGGYEILCSSYSPETGRYELTVEEQPRPEYYGVFVGIEEYGEEWGEAPLCDEDAENMYDAFVLSGLMDRDNGIVLTNRQAETRDVEDAFDEIGRRIGPNDVFIFFFSGHGTQVETSSRSRSSELDGLDEAISLRDADLTDDEFARLLEPLDAKLMVVVIDACNSGGMAPDIVSRDGIVCYASSEEDVLSDFAPELDAGGYLAVFFREAIMGDGDIDGDGVIMFGELTHYLLSRYYQDGPNTEMAIYGYPELVHQRGLVTQDTIFCWWLPSDRGSDREKP